MILDLDDKPVWKGNWIDREGKEREQKTGRRELEAKRTGERNVRVFRTIWGELAGEARDIGCEWYFVGVETKAIVSIDIINMFDIMYIKIDITTQYLNSWIFGYYVTE